MQTRFANCPRCERILKRQMAVGRSQVQLHHNFIIMPPNKRRKTYRLLRRALSEDEEDEIDREENFSEERRKPSRNYEDNEERGLPVALERTRILTSSQASQSSSLESSEASVTPCIGKIPCFLTLFC